jgi:hypothetical protein
LAINLNEDYPQNIHIRKILGNVYGNISEINLSLDNAEKISTFLEVTLQVSWFLAFIY